MHDGNDLPLIKNNKPSKLPHRGPLKRPVEVTNDKHLLRIIEETDVLLRASTSFLFDDSTVDKKRAREALPLLERAQRNILYLCTLSEL